MPTQSSFTFVLSEEQKGLLAEVLARGNYRPAIVEHATFAADGDKCRIVLYKSGKLVVQGGGAQEFVSFVLEPLVLLQARLGYEDVIDPDAASPHMGVDESGKGDFFGPLVVASVYTDQQLTATMREMGVRDSKKISSDRKALEIARAIRDLVRDRYTIIAIGPERYNQLYAQFRNVNAMLAWAHARAIENMLEKIPDCPRAISDQFGAKSQVERALMKRGRRIELVQRHRAESDMAVAAASILARERFLLSLKQLTEKQGVTCPKGASSMVRDAAVELVRRHGPEVLLTTVKCHFRTTDAVLAAVGKDRGVLGPVGAVRSKTQLEEGAASPAADAESRPPRPA